MAFRILKQLTTTRSKVADVKQYFNYLLVLDFEATCIENGRIQPQEIIEFPCAAVSTVDWEVKDLFHHYVKPKVNPQLSTFCSNLTGILQEMVDDEPHFPEVFSKFREWTEDRGYFKDNVRSAFVTCGDWDLKVMLPEQCAIDDLTVPEEFKQWVNLKTLYSNALFYYPRNLTDMLSRLNLPMKGRLHSGIDDVINMTRIMHALQEKCSTEVKITSHFRDKDGLNKVS